MKKETKISDEQLVDIKLAIDSGDTDLMMFIFNGNEKQEITLPKIKKENIKKGDKYYSYNSEHWKWELITITYVRSNVIFYTSDLSKLEEGVFRDTLFVEKWEPIEFTTDLNTEYYEIITSCSLTKIIYVND